MWKKSVSAIRSALGPLFQPFLAESPPLPISYEDLDRQAALQQKIYKAQLKQGIAPEQLEQLAERLIRVDIPMLYRDAISRKPPLPEIILSTYHFQGKISVLDHTFPILQKRLKQLGITATRPIPEGIWIKTSELHNFSST